MWAKDFKECVVCGTTDHKFMAKGMCERCYLEQYRNNPVNKARAAQSKHRWYLQNGGAAAKKVERERRTFSGNRDAVLQRDGFKCVCCGETRLSKLTVHHKDGNGRGCKIPNNSMENLQTLCRRCHAQMHYTLDRWARDHDSCIRCGTTMRPHNAKGYCTVCYSAANRKANQSL
jgi:5-methylcytosine-specific restriction endonuclease McrA